MFAEDLGEHVAVARCSEHAFDDHVIADARAVADGVSDEPDVVPVGQFVLAKDDSAEVVLADVRGAGTGACWRALAMVVLPDAKLLRKTTRWLSTAAASPRSTIPDYQTG